MSEDPFLSRWSRLKSAATKAAPGSAGAAPKTQAQPIAPVAVPDPPAAQRPTDAEREAAPLPPAESLTPESDFSPFMGAKVEESVKRRALKTLFQDPRFNLMDGLDVYIDDYARPDPLPDGWLEKMSQMAHMGDRPARLEEERTTPKAEAEPPEEARNLLPDGQRAPASAAPQSSDTAEAVDPSPPVQVSQAKGIGLP